MKPITSGEIRDIVLQEALSRLVMAEEYGEIALDDSFSSIMVFGPPGVGKSSLQYLAIRDVAGLLGDERKRRITPVKISLRISQEKAEEIAKGVINGEVIPYVHLYMPQTKIWHLEGTPSPEDHYIELHGKKIPYNVWRLDPFLVPLLDYTDIIKNKENLVTPLLVLDEFNMGRRDVREALFQLARSAELGKAKLNPLTVITLLGNTPETNIYAEEELPLPLLNRSTKYVITKVTLDGWLDFMNTVYGKKWSQEVGGFLSINPKYLYRKIENDVITPRTWTFLATRIYSLKRLLGRRIIDRDKYWKGVERLSYSLLPLEVGDEFYGFLVGLRYVNIKEILDNPERLAKMDKNVVAYALVKIVSMQMYNYKKIEDTKVREKLLKKLVEIADISRSVLGNEAVAIIMNGLPEPVRIKFSKMLPSETKDKIRKTVKELRELEQAVG